MLLDSCKFNEEFIQNGKFVEPAGRADEKLEELVLRIPDAFPKASHEAVYARLMKMTENETSKIRNVDSSKSLNPLEERSPSPV